MKLLLNIISHGISQCTFNLKDIDANVENENAINYINDINKDNKIEDTVAKDNFREFIMEQLKSQLSNYDNYTYEIMDQELSNSDKMNIPKLTVYIEAKKIEKKRVPLNFILKGEINDTVQISAAPEDKTVTEYIETINEHMSALIPNLPEKKKFCEFIKKQFEYNLEIFENYEYKIPEDEIKFNHMSGQFDVNVEIIQEIENMKLLLDLTLTGEIQREVTISTTTNDKDIINYIKGMIKEQNVINTDDAEDKFNNFIEEHLSYYVPMNYECKINKIEVKKDNNNKNKIMKVKKDNNDKNKIPITMTINVKKREIDDFENKVQRLNEKLEELKNFSRLIGVDVQTINGDIFKKIKDCLEKNKNLPDLEKYSKLKESISNFIKLKFKTIDFNKSLVSNQELQDIAKRILRTSKKSKNIEQYKKLIEQDKKLPGLLQTFYGEVLVQAVAKLQKQDKFYQLCLEINKNEKNSDLKNFRAELFKNKDKMNSIIEKIIKPIARLNIKNENFGVFKGNMEKLFKNTFVPDSTMFGILKKDNKDIINNIGFEQFKIFSNSSNQANLDYSGSFYRASYNKTHKFDTTKNEFNRFGVSIIEFKNAIVQGVYNMKDGNERATDGMWIYNEDWISKFKENVKNGNIVFTNAGFIDTKKSKSNDYQESAQNILGKKPDAYKIKGLLNNDVKFEELLKLIINSKKTPAKITKTYEANTPQRLYDILNDVDSSHNKANPTEFLFIVLTEAECGPDRGGHAALKALREICRKISDELNSDEVKKIRKQLNTLKNTEEYATCNIFHEVIDKLFLFTQYGGGGLQQGINNIKFGNEQFKTSFQENNKEQTIKKTKNLDNKQLKEDNKEQTMKKPKNLDNKQFKEDNEDEQIINNSNKGSLWKKIGQTIFGNMKKTTLDYSDSEDENPGKGFSKK